MDDRKTEPATYWSASVGVFIGFKHVARKFPTLNFFLRVTEQTVAMYIPISPLMVRGIESGMDHVLELPLLVLLPYVRRENLAAQQICGMIYSIMTARCVPLLSPSASGLVTDDTRLRVVVYVGTAKAEVLVIPGVSSDAGNDFSRQSLRRDKSAI